MPGINQLPAGSEFAAAISLVYSSTSLVCGGLLMWLTWIHHEKYSYLALLALFATFSTAASIVQQARDITYYQDIATEEFARKKSLSPTDPELAIANGSFGVDLVLYYLRRWSLAVVAPEDN